MKAEPGTYAVVLRGQASAEVTVGQWGLLHVKPDYYVYVGSAFGPGGVRTRVERHYRKSKRRHWHIDYLCDALEPIGAWCSYAPNRLEHEWAAAFGQRDDYTCIKGFGSSDCRCDGHLFTTSKVPDCAEVLDFLGGISEFHEHRRAA